MSQLFVVKKIHSSNTVYISSTTDLSKRIYSHIELEPNFDMTSHFVYVLKLTEGDKTTDSKYNAYQLDKILQRVSSNYDEPYQKCPGSSNHYYYNNIFSLCNFLDSIGVKYVQQQLNTDDLRDMCQSYSSIECQEFILDEMRQFENATVNEQDYNEVQDLFMKDNDLDDNDLLLD